MSQHFTHLHLHTEFSLLDGAIGLDKLIAFGKEQKFKAMAITDHGNIFGAVKFFQKCKKAGIKPIIGIEAYLTEDVTIKALEKKYYHLILLVQNDIGYKNLCKLISFSYQEGFYFKPRIDYKTLEKYSEGLIVTSACLGGHIPTLLMNNNEKEAANVTDWFLRVFGPERFYLEVQPEDQKDQVVLNQKLYAWSKEKNIQLVAAGDCHYLSKDDHEAHEVMLSIQTHDKIDNPDRYTFGDCRVYMRTQDEMLEIFKDHPEAVWNSGKIADMCNFEFETGKLFFPKFEIPAEHTQESFFKQMCQEGLDRLLAHDYIDNTLRDQYQARLNLEADLIINMGFVGYFLVVSDFIQWSYRSGVPVGPGRGSAAGSLVAWALQITNIDPLKYNLLFERFLNPERVTMPDIDIDFCIEGRERVIDYIREKYGHDKVCQIITFGTMMAKGVIKDVARALGFSFEDSNAITNLIPEQLKITLKEALEQEPRLQELIDGNPKAKKLFDIAFRLEGVTRHASKHAAGIVISPAPIDEVLPIFIPAKSTELVTQYAMTELESLGFLKIDLLGLKNLTLIERTLTLIKQNYGITIDINKLPLDDPKTFALICEGKTSGVFQLESDGLKEVLRKLQPEKFEDIIAVNALYRPGPLGSGMVDDFIERKHGRQKIVYQFPELATVLQETYGVIVYQEQVMKIASLIGGYSLGEADILRRAMGKKKAEVMAEQKEIFFTKAVANGFDGKKAGELFDLMAYFAGYGFNKSHSAAYALIAYQTAYLKANYTAEFMACLISLEATNAENMSFYLQEAKDMGLEILPPNINTSHIHFTVINPALAQPFDSASLHSGVNALRPLILSSSKDSGHSGALLFGLLGIKNVGLASLENIIAEREKKPFIDLMDFCKRIDLRTSNKRVIENLISAGALDTMPGNRAQKHAELGQIIDLAVEFKKNEATGQMGLFGNTSKGENTFNQDDPALAQSYGGHGSYIFQPLAEWPEKEKLEKEKEVIGFYLSAHPLDSYKKQLKALNIQTFAQLLALQQHNNSGQELVVIGCGLLKTKREIVTKKGDRMAFVQLEDSASNAAEIILFPKTFAKVQAWLDTYQVFIVKGGLDTTSTQKCKIKANDFVPLELFFEQWPEIAKISLHLPTIIEEPLLKEIQTSLTKGSIPLELIFHENGKKLQLVSHNSIVVNTELIQTLEKQNVGVTIQL